jgi:cbb3-type cytochrome oxidase subunit 3
MNIKDKMMKKKMIISVIVVLLLIVSIGGGFYMFKQKEKAEVVEWEKVAARRLKEGFADIKEIRFSTEYNYNHLAGFVAISAEITTSSVTDIIGISLPVPENESEGIGAYGEPIKLILGKTINSVKVVYSDLSEEEI